MSAAPTAAFLLVGVNLAVGVIGTGRDDAPWIIGQVPLLSKASERAHAAHRRLSHLATSLNYGGNTMVHEGKTGSGNTENRGGTAYRVATGLAVAAALVLFWMNAAVGIIGDGPVNVMYLGVLTVGFVGAVIARFEPRGMALALLATAVAQMVVPVIALVIWKAGWEVLLLDPTSPNPPFDPGIGPVFGLNAVFALLWVVSALGFRKAARGRPEPGAV